MNCWAWHQLDRTKHCTLSDRHLRVLHLRPAKKTSAYSFKHYSSFTEIYTLPGGWCQWKCPPGEVTVWIMQNRHFLLSPSEGHANRENSPKDNDRNRWEDQRIALLRNCAAKPHQQQFCSNWTTPPNGKAPRKDCSCERLPSLATQRVTSPSDKWHQMRNGNMPSVFSNLMYVTCLWKLPRK